MPKKINHAGEMQNYVPKGNGEISGEYGDDITGSNVHYKAPSEDGGGIAVSAKSRKQKTKQEKAKAFEDGLKKGFEGEKPTQTHKIQDEITKNFNGKVKGILQKDYDDADPKAKEMVERVDVEIRTTEDFKRNIPQDFPYRRKLQSVARGSFYFDDLIGYDYKHKVCFDGSAGRGARKGALFHELGHAIDRQLREGDDNISVSYRLKNGKTLVDVIEEEYRAGAFNQAIKDYNNEMASLEGGNFNDYDDYVRKCNDLNEKYADIGDILDASTKGRKFIGGSHGAKYWATDPTRRAKEAFAELFSAKSSNPQSYELFKKYLPKTTEAFNELYEYVYNERKQRHE